MLKFTDGVVLNQWFGDFGGGFCINDTANERYNHPEIAAVEAIKTDEFEENFRKVIKELVPELKVREEVLSNGTRLTIVPALGRYYNVAGHVALALTQGKDEIYNGTYNAKTALALAKLANRFNLKLELHLGAKISSDKELVEQIKALGTEPDDKLADQLFDMPYVYVLAPFTDPRPGVTVTDTANYGDYPGPALAGLLASIYGEDLKAEYGTDFDAVVVPTVEGTNALSIFKAYKNEKADLISVEENVSQEFHLIDHNCYTLSVRRSDHDEMNLTLCPELVDLWRNAYVSRLGADRVRKYDDSLVKDLDVNHLTKRALALALEKKEYKNILIMEAE